MRLSAFIVVIISILGFQPGFADTAQVCPSADSGAKEIGSQLTIIYAGKILRNIQKFKSESPDLLICGETFKLDKFSIFYHQNDQEPIQIVTKCQTNVSGDLHHELKTSALELFEATPDNSQNSQFSRLIQIDTSETNKDNFTITFRMQDYDTETQKYSPNHTLLTCKSSTTNHQFDGLETFLPSMSELCCNYGAGSPSQESQSE